jgi:hypothetical protein
VASKDEVTYVKELASVLVTVVDTDASSKDADIKANAEIGWEHWKARTVLLKDHLALKEHALRGT